MQPVRRAVAMVVFREPPGPDDSGVREGTGAPEGAAGREDGARQDGGSVEVLSVLRPPDDKHLPNLWGLPAASLRHGEGWEDAVRRAGQDKLDVEVRPGRLLNEGETERPDYVLRMRLYEAEIERGAPSVPQPAAGITQYAEWRWARPETLAEAARRGSLCSRLCLDWWGGRSAGRR